MRIAIEAAIDAATRRRIEQGLDKDNIAATGLSEWFPVDVILRGAGGEVQGGLLGLLWGGWLHVTYLWVAEAARGQGYGTRLLREAEAYAQARGAIGATLETYSFQARPFYEVRGYEVVGAIDGFPPGHAKFFLRKALSR
jgi:GNAT superfamily N-acetyltransferase